MHRNFDKIFINNFFNKKLVSNLEVLFSLDITKERQGIFELVLIRASLQAFFLGWLDNNLLWP
jgi:hypothetical protein